MSETALDLSVLIATRSRARSIEATLESMTALDTAGLSWELVIVENGSQDDTCAVLDRYAAQLPLRWFTVTERGQNRARNHALGLLRGRVTILSDDDVLVARDWLQQWQAGTARWPDDAVFAGTIAPRFPAGTPQWIAGPRFPFRAQCFAELRPAQGEGPFAKAPFGPNFAVRTRVLQAHPFREDFGPAAGSYAVGGETELVERLRRLGHRVIYLPGPRVEHVLIPENLTVEKLLMRGFNGGRGDEWRRAMRRGSGTLALRLRAATVLPLKMVFYAVASLLPLPQARRFRYMYKYQTTRGRRYQLQTMLQPRAPALSAPVASSR